MKLILQTACVLLCAPLLSHGADLFAPQAAKTNPDAEYKYKTAAEFLNATRSGEVPRKIQNLRGDYRDLGRFVTDILQSDYHYPNRYPGKFSSEGSAGSQLLEIVTKYELAKDEKEKAEIERYFREVHERTASFSENPKFVPALDTFLKDYTAALRDHLGAEKEKQHRANMIAQKADEERQRAMEATNSKIASMRAEEEARTAAVRKAMAERDKIRAQKLAEVLASPAYKIWEASLQIEEGREMVEKGKQMLAKDDAIARESGIMDKVLRRTAGELIVAGKQLVDQAFASYKQLGGKESNPDAVKAGADPAGDYR